MENYPTVGVIVRHGTWIAAVLASLVPLAGLALTLNGWSWMVLAASVLLGAIAFGLLLSYVEIVRIISDTLLPK